MLYPGKMYVRNVFHNGIRITRSFILFGDGGSVGCSVVPDCYTSS